MESSCADNDQALHNHIDSSSLPQKTLIDHINLSSIHPLLKMVDRTNMVHVELEPQHLLLHQLSEGKFHIGNILSLVLETFVDVLGDPLSIFILFYNHVNPEST